MSILTILSIAWPLNDDKVETSDGAELIHNTIEHISHSSLIFGTNSKQDTEKDGSLRWSLQFLCRILISQVLVNFLASIFILVEVLSTIKCKYFLEVRLNQKFGENLLIFVMISSCIIAEHCGLNNLHVFRGLGKCRECLEQHGTL